MRSRLDLASALAAPPLGLRLGPLDVSLGAIGETTDPALRARLLRALDPQPIDSTSAPRRLLLAAGDTPPLGRPPLDWPFPVSDRDSFHRVLWAPERRLAMTSDESTGIWNLADFAADLSLAWIDDVAKLPSWEFAAPLRHHFHWAALAAGGVVVHAAALAAGKGASSGAALLTGPGGSGKSTTTVAAFAAGRQALAEDLCWIDLAGGAPRARRLYSTYKVTDTARARYPFVEDFVQANDHEQFDKTLVYRPAAPDAPAEAPVRALYCLSGAFADKTAIAPCSGGLVFRLLAPSTLFLMRTAAQETATRLRSLIDRLPTFHVTLGADPVAAAEAICAHAEGLPGPLAGDAA